MAQARLVLQQIEIGANSLKESFNKQFKIALKAGINIAHVRSSNTPPPISHAQTALMSKKTGKGNSGHTV